MMKTCLHRSAHCLKLIALFSFSFFHDISVGIFLSRVFWQQVSTSDKNYELKMWPLPDVARLKMEKISHLLNELPLPVEKRNASVEVKADSLNRTKEFESALMRTENLCFKSFPSNKNVFIYVGSEEFLSSVHFVTEQDQDLIIVPFNTSGEIDFNGEKMFFFQIEHH
jgi:hypothetical protein